MSNPIEPRRVAQIMLGWLSLRLETITELQSLWAGYGHICAITASAPDDDVASELRKRCGIAEDSADTTFHLILKLISPPPASAGDEGHLRKMLSYEVEQVFYEQISPQLGEGAPVAKCLASTLHLPKKAPHADELQGLLATLMTDLRPGFPVSGEKRSVLSPRQVQAALEWLASFHGTSRTLIPESTESFVLPPLEETKRREQKPGNGGNLLWLNGGYTYLATRRKEYASLARRSHSEWSKAFCSPLQGSSKSIAEIVADVLAPQGRPFETYIHGDVKSENLFTTESGDRVAFFDFQYVGLGLGACDLAKLFTCSVPVNMITSKRPIPLELSMDKGEKEMLKLYHGTLTGMLSSGYPWNLFVKHWEAALVDWCRFQASWGFWGNTEWLEARVRHILKDKEWRDWLRQES